MRRPCVFALSPAKASAGTLSVVLGMLVWAAGAHASFGVVPGSLHTTALNRDGTIDRQAGSHPYEYVVSFKFNVNAANEAEGSVRDIDVDLRQGMVGDPGAVPRCTSEEFEGLAAFCSGNTQVGIVRSNFGTNTEGPLFNVVPPHGVPLTLGFSGNDANVFENASVRTGGDYGVSVDSNNLPVPHIASVEEIVWGVPADEGHDPERQCYERKTKGIIKGCSSGVVARPFLTLPASCEGPLRTTIAVDSSEDPGVFVPDPPESAFSLDAGENPAGLTGCEELSFAPSLTLAPDTADADTPAGLTTEVSMGQGGLPAPEGLSAADIESASVTLPEGVSINPGQAAGLSACQLSQSAIGTEGPAACPNASKVGTVEIKTPLLEEALEGDVYILPADPPNLQLLVAANDPVDGIYIKLIGRVHLNEVTGQLTARFGEDEVVEAEDPALRGHLLVPQFPVSSFRLSFSGGAQAALSTPTQCGMYTTTSDFTPGSTPFTEDAFPSSTFAITAGPDGGPCPPATLPFAPSLIAGSTSDQAGGFTDFSLLLGRSDAQQRIDGLRFVAPEGLTGMLSRVPLCTNAQAETNACPEASKIGHTVVEAGPGTYPLVVPEPGREPAPIYLTEAYDGAPFGLAVVVPLHVGPFTLATQQVRARIEVDPYTSQLTVTTNPLPQEVAGVPTDLREVDAVIERPEFMVNPTNCNPSSFSGTAFGTPPPGGSGPGASAPIESRFQVGACRALKFQPDFTVSTSGRTSKADGASLTAKVTYPDVPQGTEADIALVKVELPKQLPSRLTTLQKACTSAQFEADPAGCPPASFIGYATVHTPLLPVPLSGPAIFVSHGGEAFPSLTMVLQGDGVTVDLVGATFINKAGVTSTTFKTVPDDPFSSFELTLPQGPYSALTTNGNLCTPTKTVTIRKRVTVRAHGHIKHLTKAVRQTVPEALTLPTELIAQNGTVIHHNTIIAVTNCPNTKKKTQAKKTTMHRGKGKKKKKK